MYYNLFYKKKERVLTSSPTLHLIHNVEAAAAAAMKDLEGCQCIILHYQKTRKVFYVIFFCRTLPHTTMRKMIANFSFCSKKKKNKKSFSFTTQPSFFFLANKAQNFLHLFSLAPSTSIDVYLTLTPTIPINNFSFIKKKKKKKEEKKRVRKI